jgi:hypothetical protein
MKTRFNWSAYYYDLKGADPKQFPFWQWFTHEMVSFVWNIVMGAVAGLFFAFFIFVFAGVVYQKAATTDFGAKLFCQGYMNVK